MRIGTYEYDFSWARVVSDLFSPPVIWGVLALPIAFRDAESLNQAITWATVYIMLVCVLPIVYISAMVKLGKITDIHMKVRKQRILPFLISMISTSIAWLVLRLMGAPAIMPLLAMFSLVQLAVMLGITFVWQISVHAISISGATIAMWFFFGVIPAILTLPFIVLVGAARLKLRRHTPAQVIAGAMIGLMVPMLLFMLIV